MVERVLLEAWRDMRARDPLASFNVVIADSRPLNEGPSQPSPQLSSADASLP